MTYWALALCSRDGLPGPALYGRIGPSILRMIKFGTGSNMTAGPDLTLPRTASPGDPEAVP